MARYRPSAYLAHSPTPLGSSMTRTAPARGHVGERGARVVPSGWITRSAWSGQVEAESGKLADAAGVLTPAGYVPGRT